MKKFHLINGEKAKVIKPLCILVTSPRPMSKPLIDKHGSWFQMEYTTGPNKGQRFPVALADL